MELYDATLLLSVVMTFFSEASCGTTQLTPANINDILANNELVFINFYADWCRFSQMLAPVFEDASNKVDQEFPEKGKIVFGKVDCDKETAIAQQYHVSKYPTLKLFRHGTLMKREYRGQRSGDALATYIKDMLKTTVNDVQDIDDLDNLDRKKRHIIGYFDKPDGPDHKAFTKISSQLRDDCVFHSAIGAISEKERIAGNKVVYKPPGDSNSDMIYSGQLTDANLLTQWSVDKCMPLVREITFENAEELTEEGLPFLILFHHPDDTETPEIFRKTVARDLIGEKSSVNFLVADGLKFSHPLYHLGKTKTDLPVLAIDSFRHMYLWNENAKENMEKGALLKQFISDLHTGKLHREFHHGPDKGVEGGVGPTADTGALQLNFPGQENMVQLNVQKQIIMHGDGVQVQVVRLVQVGQLHKQVDIASQLKALAEATGHLIGGVPVIPPTDEEKVIPPVDDAAAKGDDAAAKGDDAAAKGDDAAAKGDDAAAKGDDAAAKGDDAAVKGDDDDEKNADAAEAQEDADFKKAIEDLRKEGIEGIKPQEKIPEADVNPDLDSEDKPQDTPSHHAIPPKTQKAWNKLEDDRRQLQKGSSTITSIVETEESINVEAVADVNLDDENQPPTSIFRQLGPSRHRYTLLRDEL